MCINNMNINLLYLFIFLILFMLYKYRARRRMQRGLKRKPMALIKKLRKAKAGNYYIIFLLFIIHCQKDIHSSLYLLINFRLFVCLCQCMYVYIACGPLDKPEAVKTHLRNMLIVPEMIHSNVAVYNGKVFNQVQVPYISHTYILTYIHTYIHS
jgi:ribosomal protein S19